jgi:hypothetical protein
MADVTDVVSLVSSIPEIEVITCVASDGETYTSQKFGAIVAATVSKNSDSDAAINVTFSGAVATINYASASDAPVTLVLFGNPGN